MKSHLKAIAILNKAGDVRVVPLLPGVNIITGDSKTGKSALIEIIDYCLCSSRCTIPKGKITQFGHLYVILLQLVAATYVLARYSTDAGGKMHVIKEPLDFEIEDINPHYFSDKPQLPYNDAKNEIESALGLCITNISTEDDQSRKASLRNMVSYLFQHQNLMASKFALFYRFTDFYKRKDVIDQFPIFAGMIGQEYYSDLIRLRHLQTTLKQKKKEQNNNSRTSQYAKENLAPLLADYYALLNLPFDSDASSQRLLEMAYSLPEFDDSQLFQDNGIAQRYHQLNTDLETLRDEEREIAIQIQNMQSAGNSGIAFSEALKELKEKTVISMPETDQYRCPMCGNECPSIAEKDHKLDSAVQWLDQELALTQKYTKDFSEDVRQLEERKIQLQSQIQSLLMRIRTLEERFIKSHNLVSQRERANFAKARIKLYADINDNGLFSTVDQDILDLEEEIRIVRAKLDGFDIQTKMRKAQGDLSISMNRLAKHLDFEDEYRPIDLNFGLTDGTFDLYHHQNGREKIYLYEMGSGANWVSCHIALFLSFLRYFASQDKSPMPLIMFFDQPSQVYFPQGLNETADRSTISQSDILAVNRMYEAIFDEIECINKDTGVLPQLIIVDHVSGAELAVAKRFNLYLRQDWRNGQGLI